MLTDFELAEVEPEVEDDDPGLGVVVLLALFEIDFELFDSDIPLLLPEVGFVGLGVTVPETAFELFESETALVVIGTGLLEGAVTDVAPELELL